METLTQDRDHNPRERSLTEDSARRLADLESLRPHLVRAVLDTRAVCERANLLPASDTRRPREAQLLLSAAVRDLEELDDQLDQARNPSTQVLPGTPRM